MIIPINIIYSNLIYKFIYKFKSHFLNFLYSLQRSGLNEYRGYTFLYTDSGYVLRVSGLSDPGTKLSKITGFFIVGGPQVRHGCCIGTCPTLPSFRGSKLCITIGFYIAIQRLLIRHVRYYVGFPAKYKIPSLSRYRLK